MNLPSFITNNRLLRSTLRWEPADEFRLLLAERQLFFAEAERRFAEERPAHGSLRDYKRAFYRHRVTYSEYMYSYEYWRFSEDERDQFISTSEMQCIYRKLGDPEVRQIFHDKSLFLNNFQPFIHRKWAVVSNLCYEEFREMIQQSDCLIKPIDGTRGAGIKKICYKDDKLLQPIYEKCANEHYIIEECIESCTKMAEFHPQSLNTIRVVTISGKGGCSVFGAIFRMGTGNSFIDNTHAGGIFAPINVHNGTIESPAIDGYNRTYNTHPDSGKRIIGFTIPHWQNIVETCQRATQQIPNIHFAGWDLCLLPDGRIEIIEGNHAPDFDGGMQAPLKIGVKSRLQKTVQEMVGIDPIPLISIFAKTKKQG